MGEKKQKKILDFTCEYCGKRYNLEELKEDGYVDETSVGLVVTCKNVKCETQQLIK